MVHAYAPAWLRRAYRVIRRRKPAYSAADRRRIAALPDLARFVGGLETALPFITAERMTSVQPSFDHLLQTGVVRELVDFELAQILAGTPTARQRLNYQDGFTLVNAGEWRLSVRFLRSKIEAV